MKLSDLSIRRPVLASMLSLALVLFGALGYFQLSVREFPDVDPPIVSVSRPVTSALITLRSRNSGRSRLNAVVIIAPKPSSTTSMTAVSCQLR